MAKHLIFYIATVLSLGCLIGSLAGTDWVVIKFPPVLGNTLRYSVSLFKAQIATTTAGGDPSTFGIQGSHNLCDDDSVVAGSCCDESKQVIGCMGAAIAVQFICLLLHWIKRKESGLLMGILTALAIFSGIVLPAVGLYLFRESGCYIVLSHTDPQNYLGIGAWLALSAIVINLVHNFLAVISAYAGRSEYTLVDS